MDLKGIESQIDSNTIAVLGSACDYSYGIIEPIEELAKLAREKGDAKRGAKIFFDPGLSCAKCHEPVSGDRLGPDTGRALGRGCSQKRTDSHAANSGRQS